MTTSGSTCRGCSGVLVEPFIECGVCENLSLCLHCFSRGLEVADHKNDHDYSVMNNKFPLRPHSHWTAREEIALLGAIEDHGLGNWHDISNQLKTKSADECCRHYLENFIEKPLFPLLDLHMAKKRALESVPSPTKQKPAVKKVSTDPPRPALGSQQSNEMAGYIPWRGEFQIEYQDNGELIVQDMSFDDANTALERELNLAVVDIYQDVLEERWYRKRILRDYGLLSWKNHRVYGFKQLSSGRDIQHLLRPFMRLHSPEQHDKLLLSIAYELKLKEDVCRLQEYRSCGVRSLRGAELYEQLKNRRSQLVSKPTAVDSILSTIDAQTKHWAVSPNSSMRIDERKLDAMTRGRKPARRLDISAAPGIDTLSDEERELCSSLRLQPLAYMKHKATLIQESERLGGLRLADARRFIHIDVNKTRKLFDYFRDHDWIQAIAY